MQQVPGWGSRRTLTPSASNPARRPSAKARFIPQTSSVWSWARVSNGQFRIRISAPVLIGSNPCSRRTSQAVSRSLLAPGR
jgi:hypothetical protein